MIVIPFSEAKKFSGLDEDWIPFTINLADAAQSHSGLIVSDFSLTEALDPMTAGDILRLRTFLE